MLIWRCSKAWMSGGWTSWGSSSESSACVTFGMYNARVFLQAYTWKFYTSWIWSCGCLILRGLEGVFTHFPIHNSVRIKALVEKLLLRC